MTEQIDQWDESVRGKKMSDATGRVIFKYQMPVLEQFTMQHSDVFAKAELRQSPSSLTAAHSGMEM